MVGRVGCEGVENVRLIMHMDSCLATYSYSYSAWNELTYLEQHRSSIGRSRRTSPEVAVDSIKDSQQNTRLDVSDTLLSVSACT